MPPRTAPGMTEADKQVLYAIIDDVGKNFTTVDAAKKEVVAQFKEAEAGRKITAAELDLELKRMVHAAGVGVTPKTLFSKWPLHKSKFISASAAPGLEAAIAAVHGPGAMKSKAAAAKRTARRRGKKASEDSDSDYVPHGGSGAGYRARSASAPASQPDPQPALQPATVPAFQPETQSGAQPETQSAAQPETQSAAQPETQSATVPAPVPATQPAAQPAAQPAVPPAVQPATKPATKPRTKPAWEIELEGRPPALTRELWLQELVDRWGIPADQVAQRDAEDIASGPEDDTDVNDEPAAPEEKTTWELDPMEAKLITDLRDLQDGISAAYYRAPEAADIRLLMENSMRRLAAGIRCFLEAHPNAVLSSARSTAGAEKLSRVLVGKEDWNLSHGRVVEGLSDSPGATVELILQAYAAAAVHKWVFGEFDLLVDELLASGDRQLFNVLQEGNSKLFKNFKIYQDLDYLDRVVKPSLPSHAKKLEHRLFEVVRCLCVSHAMQIHGEGDGTATSVDFVGRLEHYRDWQKVVTRAMHDLLELSLRLQKAPFRYFSQFPTIGSRFKKRQMVIFKRGNENITYDSKVFICLQPAIMTIKRKNVAYGPEPIAPAKVLIDSNADGLWYG